MACATAVEKAVRKVPGVSEAGVNFTTEKLQVSFDEAKTDRETIQAAVKKAGYEVSESTGKQVVIPIGGMTCSSCANAVERATGKLPGVSHVSVNFATEKMNVWYDPELVRLSEIKQAVVKLVEDLIYLKDLSPHMVGIGPFIPHHDTPLANETGGSVDLVITLLALIRLLLPDVLLPATTALGSIDPLGREKGILAGANVVMPNLTPVSVRPNYMLYDGKICIGDEAAECRMCIERRINRAGFSVDMSVGDHPSWKLV